MLVGSGADETKLRSRMLGQRANATAAMLAIATAGVSTSSSTLASAIGAASGASWLISAVAARVAEDPPRSDYRTFCPALPPRLDDLSRREWSVPGGPEGEAERWAIRCAGYAYSAIAALVSAERLAGIREAAGTSRRDDLERLSDLQRTIGRYFGHHALDFALSLQRSSSGYEPPIQEVLFSAGYQNNFDSNEGWSFPELVEPGMWGELLDIASSSVNRLLDLCGFTELHREILPLTFEAEALNVERIAPITWWPRTYDDGSEYYLLGSVAMGLVNTFSS